MEILAACASRLGTPRPGKLSFTSALIREIAKQIKGGKGVTIRWLHTTLWDNKTQPALTRECCRGGFAWPKGLMVTLGRAETPVYFSLARHDMQSIVLAPLPSPEAPGFAKKQKAPSSFLFLKVSLDDDPTGRQIANWLQGFTPSIVRGIDIEGMVLKARNIQALTQNGDVFAGPVLGKLSPRAKQEILDNIHSLSRTMITSAWMAQQGSMMEDKETVLSTASTFQSKFNGVRDSLARGVLLQDELDLVAVEKEPVVQAAGLGSMVSLRRSLLSSDPILDKLELPQDSISWSAGGTHGQLQASGRFRFGMYKSMSIIAEAILYDPASEDCDDPPPSTMAQIKRMAMQLRHEKWTSFHILTGVGYVLERHSKTLLTVFDLGSSTTSPEPMMLSSAYTRSLVPLGDRIRLAHHLCEAIQNFHHVGWVHKSIKSSNVLLFQTSGEDNHKDIDIASAQLFLFGFESSRPGDEETDKRPNFALEHLIYSHPDRWGHPTAKFETFHDTYSLVRSFLARFACTVSFSLIFRVTGYTTLN